MLAAQPRLRLLVAKVVPLVRTAVCRGIGPAEA
jgi:hypothetical protein